MNNTSDNPARTIALLEKLQDLLHTGKTTTTYKFAILRALCDIAIAIPPDVETIDVAQVSAHVVHLFWRQVTPFKLPSGGTLTLQFANSKIMNPVVFKKIEEWQADQGPRAPQPLPSARMRQYAASVSIDLQRYAIPLLQRRHDDFLYRIEGDILHMQPGVLSLLRQFYSLIVDLVESEWTRRVERWNVQVGGRDALRDHLFGGDRTNLRSIVDPLLELQENRCFYSNKPISDSSADVDHFIPWSLARNDSVGNLVLADRRYNNGKRDGLAELRHRKCWETRNVLRAPNLERIAKDTGLTWDPIATLQIANWAYRRWSNAG